MEWFRIKTLSHFETHKKSYFLYLIILLSFSCSYGQELPTEHIKQEKNLGLYFAQYQDSGDTYDPFADYSEFDNVTEEEADINFFKHGRLLSIGGLAGARMFTRRLFTETRPTFVGGLFVSFFFSLKLAIQTNFIWGIHPLRIPPIDGRSNRTFTSQMLLTQLGFDMKYYLNTQNVTQGLAIINPYLILGPDILWQEIQIRGVDARESRLKPDRAIFGFHGGIGIEFPFTLNRAFFGIELQYQFVQLPRIPIESGNPNAGYLVNQGDVIKGLVIIGVNF